MANPFLEALDESDIDELCGLVCECNVSFGSDFARPHALHRLDERLGRSDAIVACRLPCGQIVKLLAGSRQSPETVGEDGLGLDGVMHQIVKQHATRFKFGLDSRIVGADTGHARAVVRNAL